MKVVKIPNLYKAYQVYSTVTYNLQIFRQTCINRSGLWTSMIVPWIPLLSQGCGSVLAVLAALLSGASSLRMSYYYSLLNLLQVLF